MVVKAFTDHTRHHTASLRSSELSSVNLTESIRFMLSSSSMKGKQMASWVSKVTNYALKGLGSRSFNYSETGDGQNRRPPQLARRANSGM
mmetsp:Transcript_32753/g.59558  ORF Transcript_32753/g.59558 Transcript_32753/m.59558 type:complete len:90 (+) Transcript_32753:2-271(+)